MKIENINIKLLNEKAIVPTYGSTYSAGADLYACINEKIEIKPGETHFINTGINEVCFTWFNFYFFINTCV